MNLQAVSFCPYGKFYLLWGMKGMIVRGLRAACDILLPRLCVVCGKRLLLDEEHICLECLADMPQTFFWTMSHNLMADRFNEIIEGSSKAEDGSRERYAYAAALFFYQSEADYRLIPYQIKYHGNIDAGRYFGRMLGRRLASSGQYADVDLIVPVPLHWTRRWKRGYNQAEAIASGVAEAMGVQLRTDILKRIHRTKTQTKVSVSEKAENVSGAFAVCEDKVASDSYRHILLIDDIFTTGSTMGACFFALREGFPIDVRISVATLGFVGR